MDEDKFALVEKILKDVHNILTKNNELCSFDIVPVDSNFRNKSPVLYFENCLGLESWCVKHVYLYCYSEIMDKYYSKPKRKALKITSMVSERLTKLLNITLLLNPDLSSLWNKRREMVLQELLDKPSELRFSKLVLSRKPKCNDSFAYRRWILNSVLHDEQPGSNYLQSLVNEELCICELASDKSPNNYHSWNHRTWIVNRLRNVQNFNCNLLFVKEYEFSERWTAKHISDFSCYHYRQFCIKNIFQITNDSYKMLKNSISIDLRRCFVGVLVNNLPNNVNQVTEEKLLTYSDDSLISFLLSHSSNTCSCMPDNIIICRKLEIYFHELVLNDEMLRFYKYHETLWYHRRFVVHGIISLIYDYLGLIKQNGALVRDSCKKCNVDDWKQKAKIVRYDCNHAYTTVLFNVIKFHEKKFIGERVDDKYANRHEKYLKFVEGLDNVI